MALAVEKATPWWWPIPAVSIAEAQAKDGMDRLEIWSFSRTNPFNPFPGIGSKLASRLEHRAAKALWKWRDKQAEAKGVLSSWHPVSGHVMSNRPLTE